jgi:serine O-acetyltransferase
MKISMSPDLLREYVHRLVAHHIPDSYACGDIDARPFKHAIERVEHCFAHIRRKYYYDNGVVALDHLNGDHMATLIYFYANSVWRETGDTALPIRLFYLSKIMHGLDLFYSVAMPEVFMLVHPLGTVLGNATYKDFLVVYQNCTVGAVNDNYPRLGKGTILYSRSSVIGNCTMGDNVVLAANALVLDSDVPANTVVVGQHPALRLLPNALSVRERCFDLPTVSV